jgi:iron complex outermembrane receptor protein
MKARQFGLTVGVSGLALLGMSGPSFAQNPASPEAVVSPASRAAIASDAVATPQATEDAEILVTAQRRTERLQDVPISITALDQDALTDRNINTLQDLPFAVPTLKGGFAPGITSVRLGIRGLGSAGNSAIEPSVATFVDGVYIPRAGSVYGTMVDLSSVEVLSGPQGTLFGRNASVGAINIRTGEPGPEFGGRFALEAGTGERYRAEGTLNVPLSETVSFRVAGLAQLMEGFWDSPGPVRSGLDDYAGRAALRIQLSPSLIWTVRADYSLTEGGGWPHQALFVETLTPATEAAFRLRLGGLLPDTNRYDNFTNQYTDEYSVHSTHWGASSHLGLDFGDGFNLRLTNSFRLWRDVESDGDVSSTPLPFLGRSIFWRSASNSHELQLSSPPNRLLGGNLSFVAGLYYFGEDLTQDYSFNFLANYCPVLAAVAVRPACIAGPQRNAASYQLDQETSSFAGYVQASYDVTNTVEVTLGTRYTHDDKTGLFVGTLRNPAASGLQTNETTQLAYSQGQFTYRANLAWRPLTNLMLFASYSTGFKSGGFNSGNSSNVLGQLRVFRPETVQNYELGFRFQTRDRALTFNATAFRTDVNDFQERAQTGLAAIVRNVGSLRQQGVEADAVLRIGPNFRINMALSYLDSEFLSYPNAPGRPGISSVQDLTGFPLTFSPELSGTLGGEYTLHLRNDYRISLRSDVSYSGSYYASNAIDGNPNSVQDAYALLSARLTLSAPDDRWSVAVFGDNLADRRYCATIANQTFDTLFGVRNPTTGTALKCFIAAPRRLGVRAEVRF